MSGPSRNKLQPDAALSGLPGALPQDAVSRKRISSAELLAGEREILIDHSGETYRLRHTSLGKLILTK